ncbi:MAG: hypothetical protein LC753_16310, partial [Acidobacteria bacterium]|nr:hypothetical protein [Acidobacteriota bacterium]
GPHWPLLLAQLLLFGYVYPAYRTNVPVGVIDQLLERARTEGTADSEGAQFTRGPLISRFSFTIDVREWGFSDPSVDLVREARNNPHVRAIVSADVWNERGDGQRESRVEPSGEEPALLA